MKRIFSFLLVCMLVAGAGGLGVTVKVDSLRVCFQSDGCILPDGWFPHGEALKVIDPHGALWLVAGNGVQFDGRRARMTGWVDPKGLGIIPQGRGLRDSMVEYFYR